MINCPKCSTETLVETPALGNIPLDVCPGCSGIWFDKGELEALLNKSQGGSLPNFNLIDPKAEGLECPRCKSKMTRGGLADPLLLVDRCQSCGGVWLDPHELDVLKKLLGLTGGPSAVTVARPAAVPAAPPALDVKTILTKLAAAVCAILGLVAVSMEMYLYYSPADSVSHAPSMGVLAAGVLFFVGGVFVLKRRK